MLQILYGFGIAASGIIGIFYFFSSRFRARKQKEWESQEPDAVRREWQEWLLGLFLLAVLVAAVIATALK